MIKVAVCSREQHLCEIIKECVNKCFLLSEELYKVDTYGTGMELVDSSDRDMQDIVFYDIDADAEWYEMIRRMNVCNGQARVVIVSNTLDCATEGYKVNAARYILKNSMTIQDEVHECIASIYGAITTLPFVKKFKFIDGKKNVNVNRILYIESKGHNLEVHMLGKDSDVYVMRRTMDELERELLEYGFIRTHKSFMVNRTHIVCVDKGEMVIRGGIRLPISRTRIHEVKEILKIVI